MNVFEDLIEELKEENLLEETVTEIQSQRNIDKSKITAQVFNNATANL